MEEGLFFITTYLEEFTYAGIFFVLLLAGCGFPIPEEPVLILSGYLTFLEYTQFPIVIIVAFTGVLAGDFTLFSFGRKWGNKVLNHHQLSWLFTERRLSKGRRFFRKYGKRTIFFARFLSGVRAPVYLIAGTLKMGIRGFVLMDILAAIISVPLLVFLGFFFGDNIDWVLNFVARTEYITLTFIFFGCLIFIFFYYKVRKGGRSEIKTE